MRKTFVTVAAFLVVLSAAAVGYAHHATIGMDTRNRVELEGTIKEIHVVNPHAKWIIEITDGERGTREVEYEGHSRNHMYRDGYREDVISVGDEIRFNISPMLDGSDGGFMNWFETEDGQRISFQ
jgi:hypothetical protein